MNRWLPATGLLLLGCATSPDHSPDTGAARVEATEPEGHRWAVGEYYREGTIANIQPGVDRVSVDIDASPDAAWDALIQVYENIGIEIGGADIRTRSLNNPEMSVRRRLGGERLSTYLSCGSSLTGALADHARIQMSILSQVTAGPNGKSVVHTTIQAVGDNPEGVSNTRVPCSSTHQLEYRIAAEVAELVGG
jgi:hypothetical protein